MSTSWLVNIFFFLCILALIVKITSIQEKVEKHERIILNCINEHPFIFKADKEENSVVIICKRF